MTLRLFIDETDQLMLFREDICVSKNHTKHINKLNG
jgi:hypothetical protein